MADLRQELIRLKSAFTKTLQDAQNGIELENVRVKYLGRQGELAELISTLKELSAEEKRVIGPELNALKTELHAAFEAKKESFIETERKRAEAQKAHFDVTAYIQRPIGSLHPYTHITRLIEDIFISMGFSIVEGPEVETPFYNFEALNIPADHPAREEHDTFWLKIPGYLMRTHTSSVQIHTMQERKPPFALCAPGRAYRHEATDATHDFAFTQLEGLVVDKNLSVANLLGTLKVFLQALFNSQKVDIRVRPSYFPFVEPGLEVDVSCPFCTSGCSVCKKTCWIELGGAGMVHPAVLQACNIDPEQWSGFAWGMGIERFAMLIYRIPDIRLFKTPKLDFLKQF